MKKRLNVLWLMSDQHNANCSGYAGNPDVKTPNLDQIAKNGINFKNGFANNPICSPSRVCFITGQYMRNHRMFSNDHAEYLNRNSNTLSALFRRYGYQTGLFGKSHMIRNWDEEGFEVIKYSDLCDAKSNNPESCHYFKKLIDANLADFYEEGSPKQGQEYTFDGSGPSQLGYEHSIEKFTGDETLDFLKKRDQNRPFFVHMSFQRPHDPISPAPEYFNMYDPESITLPNSKDDWFVNKFASKCEPIKRRLAQSQRYPMAATDEKRLKRCIASYYALISSIDMEIGRVLDYLKECGELDNTIVFYTADHGDFAGEHGLFFKNLGIYESIQKIPFLLWYPGCEAGVVDERIVESIDFYTTICNLCDIPMPQNIDGMDLLDSTLPEKEASFCEWENGAERISAIRTKTARLVYWSKAKTGELYDRTVDPDELYNLWSDPNYATLKAELMEQLLSFTMQGRAETGHGLQTEFAEPSFDTSARNLIHKKEIYYSDLCKAYTSKGVWPPK